MSYDTLLLALLGQRYRVATVGLDVTASIPLVGPVVYGVTVDEPLTSGVSLVGFEELQAPTFLIYLAVRLRLASPISVGRALISTSVQLVNATATTIPFFPIPPATQFHSDVDFSLLLQQPAGPAAPGSPDVRMRVQAQLGVL